MLPENLPNRRLLLQRLALSAIPAGPLWLAGCARKSIRARLVPAVAVVLAFGDSLTFGTGAPAEASYPAMPVCISARRIPSAR